MRGDSTAGVAQGHGLDRATTLRRRLPPAADPFAAVARKFAASNGVTEKDVVNAFQEKLLIKRNGGGKESSIGLGVGGGGSRAPSIQVQVGTKNKWQQSFHRLKGSDLLKGGAVGAVGATTHGNASSSGNVSVTSYVNVRQSPLIGTHDAPTQLTAASGCAETGAPPNDDTQAQTAASKTKSD